MIRKSELQKQCDNLKEDIIALSAQNQALAWALTHDRVEFMCTCGFNHPLSSAGTPCAFSYEVAVKYFDPETVSLRTRTLCKTLNGAELKLVNKEYNVTSNTVTVVVAKTVRGYLDDKETTLYKIEAPLNSKYLKLWVNSPVGHISPVWNDVPYYNNDEDWVRL